MQHLALTGGTVSILGLDVVDRERTTQPPGLGGDHAGPIKDLMTVGY